MRRGAISMSRRAAALGLRRGRDRAPRDGVRIDPATGALTPHGEPIRLPTRPIHMTLDSQSQHILVAFNNPSSVRVYRINKDFTPGEEVKQPGTMDAGIFAHQVRVTPDNRHVVLVTRGNEGTATKARGPGRAEGVRLQERRAVQRSLDRAERRQGIRPAPSGFPSDQAVDVRVDRNAEPDPHAPHAGRQDQSGNRVSRGNAGRAEQHPLAPGGEHGARASERPFLYGANRVAGYGGFQGQEGLQGRREQHRRVRDQPDDRRADADPAHRNAERSIRARSTSTRAGACWWRSTICRWTCAMATR